MMKLAAEFFLSLPRISRNAIISFRAPMKLVALSLYIHAGFPRRAMNRFKADTQDGVDREDTSSMWTALVVKHTSNAMYAFPTDLEEVLREIGPPKSMPTCVKGRDWVIRSWGRSPIIGFALASRLAKRRQVIHDCVTLVITFLPPVIQYL